jgi:hypothetical protein
MVPIKRLDITNNGIPLEIINNYNYLTNFLNDITFKTNYYQDNTISKDTCKRFVEDNNLTTNPFNINTIPPFNTGIN